jgi:hypothetical protein
MIPPPWRFPAKRSPRNVFGVCFLLRGNMLCGTSKGRLMVRVGDQHAAAMAARAPDR